MKMLSTGWARPQQCTPINAAPARWLHVGGLYSKKECRQAQSNQQGSRQELIRGLPHLCHPMLLPGQPVVVTCKQQHGVSSSQSAWPGPRIHSHGPGARLPCPSSLHRYAAKRACAGRAETESQLQQIPYLCASPQSI